MANPAAITVTDTSANAGVNQPAVDTVDTNGTINCALGGKFRVLFELINAAANAIDVTFKAGTSEASIQSRDLKITLAATGGAAAKQLVGPLEGSRYMKPDGSIDIAFLAAAGAPNLQIRTYRMPKHHV